ncbi:LysR family transcriptional regulator [Pseudomonas thivervalensis]|uniref:LysR family transcriptional regulator n=1 Tax=Pseudomonas thivervalensis TaxID=86265 RepID=A0A2Z4ZPX7_9PSED|nr:LysR family transcriptional regulator [Pseudomonas thivervalensis]AXA54272.1 LysR family transcriptional regulator [Pseudomonas thivervalensis]AXA59952.1 LysR family transcriptional regulator [Pseudomonas thivervalensis]
MDKLGAFSTFLAVADSGSFSRAAKQLGKTPSAITKTISHLEEELGVQLLVRSTHHTTLTDAGYIYLKTARQLVLSLDEAAEEISQLRGGINGPLRIASPMAFGKAFLADACADFLSSYPNIQLSVTLGDVPINLDEGGYDLALRVGESDRIISKVIARNTVYLCASPSYLARKEIAIHPDNLHAQDWLLYRNPLLSRNFWRASYQGEVFKFPFPKKPLVECDNYDFLLTQALAGRGLLIVPQWSAAPLIAQGQLVQVMPDYLIDPEAFGPNLVAVYPSHHRSTRKVIVFIEHLRGFLTSRALD